MNKSFVLRSNLLWIVLIAFSCSPLDRPQATETPPASKTPSATETVIPATEPATPTPFTATPIPPTSTLLPTETPTAHLQQHCLEIAPQVPLAQDAGSVVFLEVFSDNWYLQDMATGRKIPLSGLGFHVSPDRRWLAYKTFDPAGQLTTLVVSASNGDIVNRLPWDKAANWRQVDGWQDNDHVWISQERLGPDPSDPYDINDALILVNPFTGEQQALSTDYPNFDLLGVFPSLWWGEFGYSFVIYAPSLKQVVYPYAGSGLVLWDVATNQPLTFITNTYSINTTPTWSPDGQRFIVQGPPTMLTEPDPHDANRSEFFSVSRDGKIERLTYFAEQYSTVSLDSDYSWSPDGRYVVFGLDVAPNTYPDLYPASKNPSPARLAVLDTLTHDVIDYCVPRSNLAAPVWSPDGRYLIFTGSSSSVFLVDLVQKLVMNVDENTDTVPVGWMVSTP